MRLPIRQSRRRRASDRRRRPFADGRDGGTADASRTADRHRVAGKHRPDHAGASKPYSFDATNVIANLQARGALKPEHTVTIVPSGQPTEEAKAVVGDISIVEQ